MGIFDKSNYIVNTDNIEQFFQCTTKMILLAKMIKLWTFYEKWVSSCLTAHQHKIGYLVPL